MKKNGPHIGKFVTLGKKWVTLKGRGKRGHIVADTLLPTHMFPRLPARATFVADTNFVFVQKHFVSATNVSQFAQPKKHHGQQCVRNNVSSFSRALKKWVTLENTGHTSKIGSQLKNVGQRIGRTLQNWSHLKKWVTQKNGLDLKKWVTSKQMGHTSENWPHWKKWVTQPR